MENPSFVSWWRQRQSTILKTIDTNVQSLASEQLPKVQQYMQQVASLTATETNKSILIGKFMTLLEHHGPIRLARIMEHAIKTQRQACAAHSCIACSLLAKSDVTPSEIAEFIHILNEHVGKKI